MPFVNVLGIPAGTPQPDLMEMRREIVRAVSYFMTTRKDWVRVNTFEDLLPEPVIEDDGSSLICVRLDTGMFEGQDKDAMAPNLVTAALLEIVWNAFGGRYEVEVCVDQLHPDWGKTRAAKR